jgi:hypothetical protein
MDRSSTRAAPKREDGDMIGPKRAGEPKAKRASAAGIYPRGTRPRVTGSARAGTCLAATNCSLVPQFGCVAGAGKPWLTTDAQTPAEPRTEQNL